MLQTGDLLLSEPYLGDENFERSVVLLGSYSEDGALGFVLNKKSELLLSDVVEDIAPFDAPLFIGGPVEQDTLHFIYRIELPLEGTIPLMEGLYWGGDFEHLKLLLRTNLVKQEDIRFFIGYSGWSGGQIDSEVADKTWIVHRLAVLEWFDIDAPEMWKKILRDMGGEYKALSNYPIDPRLN